MLVLLFSLFIGAGILGLIIAFMEEGDFPGWGALILCVLAASIPSGLINAFLPPGLFFVGMAVGAVCAGCAISALCDMTLKRAIIAASIYFGVQVALGFVLGMMMSS